MLNTYRRHSGFMMLHHASCWTIRVRSTWTKDYRKICGERGKLEVFAHDEVRADTQMCSRCFRALLIIGTQSYMRRIRS